MELHLQQGDELSIVQAHLQGGRIQLSLEDDKEIAAEILSHDRTTLLLEMNGQRYRARYCQVGSRLHLHLAGRTVHYQLLDEEDEGAVDVGSRNPVVIAPMPGSVLDVLVKKGDAVEAGQAVVRLEAMKMEVELNAAIAGTVSEVHVEKGQLVEPDSHLITIQPAEESAQES